MVEVTVACVTSVTSVLSFLWRDDPLVKVHGWFLFYLSLNILLVLYELLILFLITLVHYELLIFYVGTSCCSLHLLLMILLFHLFNLSYFIFVNFDRPYILVGIICDV